MLRGVTFQTRACDVRPITMLWVSWPIRGTDFACRKEDLCRKRCVLKTMREAGHRENIIVYSIRKIMCFFNIKACQNILLHQIQIFKKASYNPFN